MLPSPWPATLENTPQPSLLPFPSPVLCLVETYTYTYSHNLVITSSEELPDYSVQLSCAFSHVRLFTTPWIMAHQVPLSVGFGCQEYSNTAISSSRGSSQPRGRSHISSLLHFRQILYPLSHLGSPLCFIGPIKESFLQQCSLIYNCLEFSTGILCQICLSLIRL